MNILSHTEQESIKCLSTVFLRTVLFKYTEDTQIKNYLGIIAITIEHCPIIYNFHYPCV